MSGPDRRPAAVVSALWDACVRYPDQRVMQVIVNALGPDPFHVEDLDAVERLRVYASTARHEEETP